MVTKCYSMVRGSALRVTGLKSCGSIPETIQYGVSKSVTRVTINEQTEGGGFELQRNEDEDPRLHLIHNTQTIRHMVDIDFLRCDPGILNLVSGVPVVQNAAGDIVGFDSNTRIPAKAFAMEVWSRLSGEACSPGEREYGYTLFPFLKGGQLSGFQFGNGLVSFSLRNAKTRKSPKWDEGPYDLTGPYERLLTPISRNLMWRTFVTTAAPPDETDGVEEFTDVIDGGNASSTSSDILDGQFVVTSSDTVEGGYAT